MFDTHSDYAINKMDKSAIVCASVTGEDTRLTREDFSSDEEFAFWKAWSDDNYHETELTGRSDDACLSFEAQRDVAAPSAEEVALAPYIATEVAERKRLLLDYFKAHLSEKQYRRMRLYYLEGKTEAEIAVMEGTNQSSISRSISRGAKTVERFFKKFL